MGREALTPRFMCLCVESPVLMWNFLGFNVSKLLGSTGNRHLDGSVRG
jgi:hypothetical protein